MLMAKDEVLTENEDDIDIVEVDALPGEEARAAEAAAKEAAEKEPKDAEVDTDDDDDDDKDEDSRLADREEDEEESNRERQKRLNRRARQKEARDRTLQELTLLREKVALLERGQQNLQVQNVNATVAQIEAKLAEYRKDIAMADEIMAQAIRDQDGDRFAAAQRLRDEAKDQERELAAAQAAAKNVRTSEPDPRLADLSGRWKAANPWYGAPGYENQTSITNTIDAGVLNDGYDPATPAYWQELSRRLKDQIASAPREERRRETSVDKDENTRRRTPPPLGGNRDGNGQGGKRQVHLSKERVDAMKQAGVWDDPVERAKMVKAYEEYDRDNSAAAR